MDVRKCKNITAVPGPFPPHDLEPKEGILYPLLGELAIKDCPELKALHHNLPSLVKLEIKRCQALAALPNFPSLRELEIDECEEMLLELLHDNISLSLLCISRISNLVCLPEVLLRTLKVIRELRIYNCDELKFLWKDSGFENFSSLRHLEIWCCPELVSLPEGLPSMLEHLNLRFCSNLKSLPQGLHLTSLVEFKINNAEKLTSFPENGLPTTLIRLVIKECRNLKSLPKGLHNVTSLQLLEVRGCPSLEYFPEEGLPVMLKRISVFECDNLKSLPSRLHNLTSLEELRISNVPKLASFPEGGLPTMLSYLDIDACSLLTARCQKECEDWLTIAHVHEIRIDGKQVF